MVRKEGLVALRYQGTLAGAGAEPLSMVLIECEKFASEFDCYLGASRTQSVAPAQTLFRGSLLEYALTRTRFERAAAEADIVIQSFILNPFLEPGELLHYPMLEATLAVQPTLEKQIQRVRSKAHRRRLRKARKSTAYTATVSVKESDFETFHDGMYASYVRDRFGQRAYCKPRALLHGLFRARGEVVLSHFEGKPVAGALLLKGADGTLEYHSNGFADSKIGARTLAQHTAALECAVMTHAIDQRFGRIAFGYTRSLLSEGLFTHKRRMGCAFTPAPYSPLVRVKIKPSRRPAVMHGFPMISGGPGQFVAHVGYDEHSPRKTVRQWRAQLKNYVLPELTRIVFHTNVGPTQPGRVTYESALRQVAGEIEIEVLSSA